MRKPCPVCPEYRQEVEVVDNRCVVVQAGTTLPAVEAPTWVVIWCRKCGSSTNRCLTLVDAELAWNALPRPERDEDDELPF